MARDASSGSPKVQSLDSSWYTGIGKPTVASFSIVHASLFGFLVAMCPSRSLNNISISPFVYNPQKF